MFVKFCGFTRHEDVKHLCKLESVKALGFVFHKASARYVTPEKAKELGRSVQKTGIKKVGIFTGDNSNEILEAAAIAQLDILQVYHKTVFERVKKEYPAFYALRVQDKAALQDLPQLGKNAYYLLDSFHANNYGGTGHRFNWTLLEDFANINRCIIAGGINTANLHEVLKLPIYGIDLSSGIEDAPGKKSFLKMREIHEQIKESRYAESTNSLLW